MAAFRDANRAAEPNWFNGPVPSFGETSAPLLVVGLAPGLRGANRTGRPFTGDFAGDLLYATLIGLGLASGRYGRCPEDGMVLEGCAVTNAVRCVPPQNKPLPVEIGTCRPYLAATLAAHDRLSVIVALGRIAHDSVVRAFGRKLSEAPFGHGRRHEIAPAVRSGIVLFDSYHCSRYNTNTGVLTEAMFTDVMRAARDEALSRSVAGS